MMSETVVIREPLCSDQRMSWTAIFVGALVGAGLGFLLNLFGIAIGLSILTQKDGAAALAVGGLLGFLIAVITSMVVAGYTAGYLGRTYCPKRNLGVLYGFTTWGVALILTAAVASHINHYVSTYSRAISGSTLLVFQSENKGANEAPLGVSPSLTDEHHNSTNVALTRTLACSAFILFGLFFMGALSTCIGAYWGMTFERSEMEHT